MTKAKTSKTKSKVVGVEFIKLTHWDRYILNQNIARMEQKLYPTQQHSPDNDEENIWRGEKRNFYRLNIQVLNFTVSIAQGSIVKTDYDNIQVLNISSAGCCMLVSNEMDIQPGARIPHISFQFPDENLVIKGKVVHVAVMDSVKGIETSCF